MNLQLPRAQQLARRQGRMQTFKHCRVCRRKVRVLCGKYQAHQRIVHDERVNCRASNTPIYRMRKTIANGR